MRTNRKRLVLALIALIVVLVVAVFTVRLPPKLSPNAVTMTLIGFTNSPSPIGFRGHFSLFSVSNASNSRIQLAGELVEVEGDSQPHAKVITTNLPGWTFNRLLKPGESILCHFGDPYYSPETGKWRFFISFRRDSRQERWLLFANQHKLPLKLGPIVLADPNRIYHATNHFTVYSQWFSK
jgi:hypothetical protein